MAENIQTVSIARETHERYLRYAVSVITSRALPDVRDGLKPVQRRILYTMYNDLRSHCWRGDGQVPPARGQRALRCNGPHGPGLGVASPPRARPREFRLGRWR